MILYLDEKERLSFCHHNILRQLAIAPSTPQEHLIITKCRRELITPEAGLFSFFLKEKMSAGSLRAWV